MDLEERKRQRNEYANKWKKDNPEKWKAICLRYRENNLERLKENQRQEYHRNKHKRAPLTLEQKQLRSIRNREHRLKNNYGITIEQYDTMLKIQNGVCAICLKPDVREKNLSVDHCHTTGKVSGLLCSTCNPAIGALGDTAEQVQRAVKYLNGDRI